APDRARDPITTSVERRVVRRPNIVAHVHFHSVNDGMEILATEVEIAHRRDQAARAGDRLACVERIDIGTPALELLPAFVAGSPRIRDVVDPAAKRKSI